MDDRELGERFRSGDPDAVRALYRRWSGPLWSAALQALGDRTLAEEAVQETFVKAWRHSHAYDASRPLGPWLFTILARTAVDTRRRELQPTRWSHEPERDGALPAGRPFERAWETWQVRDALAQLPREERDVLYLSHFAQLTHTEIADALGVAVGTVKSRSHRARRSLAARLSHLLEEPG